ncbi:hypothetical protein [Pedobacter xixiisoli]|uniref:Lipoprotein n=1 Tax=Pedobacter xixiisoli TaxID=1476464 RepID=A0A286A8W8_9SPHI|nr:hypothetical protein [Pedobacter xixiisoli]SOD18360.1 hypothetical protein SAMN06297358_2960 [Pedobacter xixiisoli]
MKASIKVFAILGMALVSLFSCRSEEKQTTTTLADTVALPPDTADTTELEVPLPPFPKMAYKIENLIPKDYEIDLEAAGDLNNDGVADKVIVLIKTTDTTALRPTLVLLKQGNAYSVDAISYTAFDPKFRKDGFKDYDFEEVSIDSGKLVVTKQATGPAGSIESTFKYIKDDLVLTHITTFNMGAGGQTEQKFDLLKGIYEQTDINTMKEDMPSTTSTKRYKIPKALFKDSDPSSIMIEAFNKVGN